MSLLGFDAIGRWAIGQSPKTGNSALVAVAGAFSVTGSAATASISMATSSASYSLSGNAVSFGTAINVLPASYAETGHAASFTTSLNPSTGIFLVTGFQTGAITMIAVGGSYVVAGQPSVYVLSNSVGPGSYLLTGNAATLSRDFVNWLKSSDLAVPNWGAVASPISAWTPEAPPSPSWAAIGLATEAWIAAETSYLALDDGISLLLLAQGNAALALMKQSSQTQWQPET